MSLVVAAGCPISGWETILPILAQMGLHPMDDALIRLLPYSDRNDDSSILSKVMEANTLPDSLFHKISDKLQLDSDKMYLLAHSTNLRYLDSWAEKFPEARFLLFYVRSELCLASAILKDADLTNATDTWQSANHTLLRFQRKHRRQTLLFEAESIISETGKFAEVCRSYGLELKVPERVASSLKLPPPVERLLAAYWVKEQPAIGNLEAELEASAHPLNKIAGRGPDPIELLLDYQKRLTEAKEPARDNNPPLADIHTVQRLKAECDEARKENDLLLSQLHQVQEELEIVFLQKHRIEQQKHNEKSLQARIRRLEKEVEKQDRKVADLKKSTSWKVSTPVRLTARLLGRGEQAMMKAQTALIRNSDLFDEAWYLAKYPDVKADGMNPAEHYLRHGAAEGRDPSAKFSTQNYLELNPDVEEEGINPLLHYLQFGRSEGRRTSYQL